MYINTKDLEFLVNKLLKRGWLMSEIAKELGINERTLYRWTRGEIAVPRIALLAMTLIVKVG
jgi:transcriptional regulator with XRE-family HTH domain